MVKSSLNTSLWKCRVNLEVLQAGDSLLFLTKIERLNYIAMNRTY